MKHKLHGLRELLVKLKNSGEVSNKEFTEMIEAINLQEQELEVANKTIDSLEKKMKRDKVKAAIVLIAKNLIDYFN